MRVDFAHEVVVSTMRCQRLWMTNLLDKLERILDFTSTHVWWLIGAVFGFIATEILYTWDIPYIGFSAAVVFTLCIVICVAIGRWVERGM